MVEQFRHKDLSLINRDFVDTQEKICNQYDKLSIDCYERWKKERFNQQGEVNEVKA